MSNADKPKRSYAWMQSIPFGLMHIAPFGALYVDVDPSAWLLCLGLYYLRMVRLFSIRKRKFG